MRLRRRIPEKHQFAGISRRRTCTFAQDTLSGFRGQAYTLGAFKFDGLTDTPLARLNLRSNPDQTFT